MFQHSGASVRQQDLEHFIQIQTYSNLHFKKNSNKALLRRTCNYTNLKLNIWAKEAQLVHIK